MKRTESKNAGDGEDVSFDGGGRGHVGERSEMMTRLELGLRRRRKVLGNFVLLKWVFSCWLWVEERRRMRRVNCRARVGLGFVDPA